MTSIKAGIFSKGSIIGPNRVEVDHFCGSVCIHLPGLIIDAIELTPAAAREMASALNHFAEEEERK